MHALDVILHFFQVYGYWILFFGVMLENAGIPVPGETVLLAAGAYAHSGHFRFWAVLTISFAAAVIGDNCGYWLGRLLGRRFLEKQVSRSAFLEDQQKMFRNYFRRYGNRTVVVARFITGLRVFTALFAGASEMEWRSFLLCNALGAALWSSAIGSLGYFFGHNWEALERTVGWSGAILLILAILAGLSLGVKKLFATE